MLNIYFNTYLNIYLNMEFTLETILYYLVLVDAIVANLIAWSGYGTILNKRYTIFGSFLPITKGWTAYYLVLVIWLGIALARLHIIATF